MLSKFLPSSSVATGAAELLERGLAEGGFFRFAGEAGKESMSAVADAGADLFGSESGASFAALLTNDRTSVALALGAARAGARLVSLPLPGRSADPSTYLRFVDEACDQASVERLIVRDDIAELLAGVAVDVVPHSKVVPGLGLAPGPSFELVQFSSGSTGPPRGIVLSDATLGANLTAILQVVEPDAGDNSVSWLPLSHDMGLVGMLLTSVAAAEEAVGGTLTLLRPEDFLRSPMDWITALSERKATITAGPTFAYRMAAARASTAGLDLHRVRCAIVGSEIVQPDALESFIDAFGPVGLSSNSLCPAYGMAEVGLAITMSRPSDAWTCRTVDTALLADNVVVEVQPGAVGALRLAGNGSPIPGYAIEVSSADDEVGPIEVIADSFGRDLVDAAGDGDRQTRLHTTDVGFQVDDDLYICGRLDDYIVAAGRNLYAPSLETTIGAIPSVRTGRVTAVGGPDGSWAVAVEPASGIAGAALQELRHAIRKAAVSETGASPTHVVLVASGQLPMTSSGKVQRHEVRRRWIQDELDTL